MSEQGKIRWHFLSQTRRIQFTRRGAATKFEGLRKEFGADEVEAWRVYRQRIKRANFRVVEPDQYDTDSHKESATTKSGQSKLQSAKQVTERKSEVKVGQTVTRKKKQRLGSDNKTSSLEVVLPGPD